MKMMVNFGVCLNRIVKKLFEFYMKRSFELEREECGITKKPSLDANAVDFVFLPLNNFLNDVIINFLYDKKIE
jgi:hypothetical protein